MKRKNRKKRTKKKRNYKIEMKAYDNTFITVYTTTPLQKKHVIEMFEDIKERGRIKYAIKSKKV